MRSLIHVLTTGVFGALLGLATTASAATIGLTLTSDLNPMSVVSGDVITFTVGINPATSVNGYTLDIRYDTTEMDFLTSAQLLNFFGGAVALPYILDPAVTPGDPGSTGLATSSSGRAALIGLNASDPAGDLFSLSFTVTNPILDGIDDLTVGILDVRADDINPNVGGSPFTISPNTVGASIASVPEPTSFLLIAAPLAGLLGFRRKVRV